MEIQNLQATNKIVLKYIRVKLTELQGEIEESLDIDVFNSPLEI